MSRPERRGGRVTATAEAGRHACVAPTRGKRTPGAACLRRRRSQAAVGRTNEQAGGANAGLRSRSRPQRPRTGSPNVVRSAGTGKRESTFCRRDGPVAAQRSSGASRRQEGVILTSPVPGASKQSEVAPGTGRLQRTKPEGRGGLASQRESADGSEAEGSPLGRTGAGEDRLRRRREALPRRRTQPRGRAGERLAGRLLRVTGHGCAAGHVLCEAVQAA